MTKNWELKTMGDVCVYVSRGISPKYTNSDGLVVVNQKCIRDHIVNFDLARLHNVKEKKVSDEKRIQKGDVLINSTGTGTLGRVAHVTEDVEATVDSHVTIVRPNKDILDERFFAWALFNKENNIEASATGTSGQTELPRTAVNGFVISYPKDKKEQERIVKILDEKFETIEKLKSVAKQQLNSAQELFNSRLNEVFSGSNKNFELKHLSEVSEYFNGLTYSPSDQSEEGTVVLRSSNVQSDQLDFADIVRVTCKIPEKKIVKEGDILMCSRNGSKRLVGKTATITNLEEEMTFGTFMMIIRSEYNRYLGWFFKSPEFRKQITQGENTMINQITRYMLDEVVVNFPPMEEQKKIVKEFNELSQKTKELEVIFRRKISELEELKKSYLHEAFSGNL